MSKRKIIFIDDDDNDDDNNDNNNNNNNNKVSKVVKDNEEKINPYLESIIKEGSNECPVCFVNVENTRKTVTPCFHVFCNDDLQKWIKKAKNKRPTCPVCRGTVDCYYIINERSDEGVDRIPILYMDDDDNDTDRGEDDEDGELEEDEDEEDEVDENGNLRDFVADDNEIDFSSEGEEEIEEEEEEEIEEEEDDEEDEDDDEDEEQVYYDEMDRVHQRFMADNPINGAYEDFLVGLYYYNRNRQRRGVRRN